MIHIAIETRRKFYAFATKGNLHEMKWMQQTLGLLSGKTNSSNIYNAARKYASERGYDEIVR